MGSGSQRLLVDTGQGSPAWLDALTSTLKEESCTVSSALLTHWHPDHVGGVSDLRTLCPDAVVHKNAPGDAQLPITNGDVFRVEGATLRAVHTPGHTTDHVMFVLEEENGALFTGDAVLGHGTAVFEDLGVYLECLERLKVKECRGESQRGYPGHGDAIENVGERVEGYLKHRKMREGEVIAVLRKEAEKGATPKEVVDVVYKDVPQNLHLPAEGGVRQILRKLEREGKVFVGEEERWKISDKAAL